ncbi:MAG: hypothetical protein NT040_19095 [Bacteroidetes bacterium]|nr:hypothetical protein [Bacteroidota bacterium]
MNPLNPASAQHADDPLNLWEMSVEEMAGFGESADGMNSPAHEGEGENLTAAGGTLNPEPKPVKTPIVLALKKNPVSGRYRGTFSMFQLELRVDVDRTRPMNRLSADFFQVSGATTTYYGSFVVNLPAITVSNTQVVVRGAGNFTFANTYSVVQVTIPRRTILQSMAPATVQFFTTGGAAGATYICSFESIYFRTVRVETDRVLNVATPVFNSYNTGALPSGGPARNLSVISSYAEAGIEMISTPGSDIVNIGEAGPNVSWSNAELHASMQRHFSLWADTQQWSVWQLVAQLHDQGPGLYGIMFDQQGKQRQGCAVFHASIGGAAAAQQRLQLYTYVHELGHCFNLMHSWQKQYASPPGVNKPNAMSWMNYPWNYPAGGAVAFWNSFPFQFDNEEIIHLRHAYRNNIIMGGNDFMINAALGRNVMADSVKEDSGVCLNISTHQKSFALGEPVVLQIELCTTDSRGKRVHTWLHPNFGMVKVVIRKPNGEVVAYEPLIDHLVGASETTLGRDDVIKDSAYIGYGKDGFYFDQPGYYLVRATYAALDGSEVMSDVIRIRVRYPVSVTEESLADLFMGEDQGTLLYLLGSDNESLKHGNDAFDEVLERYEKHPMANYARLIKGINASRNFKTITDEAANRMIIRKAQLTESTSLLTSVATSGILDPVSAQMTLSSLADVQTRDGNKAGAKKTLSTLSGLKG